MYMPFDAQRQALENAIWSIIKSDGFKAELSNYIRLEIEASKAKYSTENNKNSLSYEMLTRGNVNMQAKMAANGYDVYGKTIIQSNSNNGSNKNIYQKMKNKINYGSNPTTSYENRGSRSIMKGE
jgi:hypothetical protein